MLASFLEGLLTGASFDWTLEDALAYRAYEQAPVDRTVPGLMVVAEVVAEDDEVVDAQETLALAVGSDVRVLPRGGPALANTQAYADAVADFIAKVTVRAD